MSTDTIENMVLEEHILTEVLPGENARSILSDDEVKIIAESIRAVGLENPPTVNYHKGEYRLVAGYKRYRALELLRDGYAIRIGKKEVIRKADSEKYSSAPFKVLSDASPELVIKLNIAENEARSSLAPIDLAHKLVDLFEKNKQNDSSLRANEGDIARGLGISNERASRLKSWVDLPEQLKKWLKDGEVEEYEGVKSQKLLNEAVVYQLTRLLRREDSEKQIMKIANEILSKGLNEEAVKKRVTKLLDEQGTSKKKGAVKLTGMYLKADTKLKAQYGDNIKITGKDGTGFIKVSFDSEDELNGILTKMTYIEDIKREHPDIFAKLDEKIHGKMPKNPAPAPTDPEAETDEAETDEAETQEAESYDAVEVAAFFSTIPGTKVRDSHATAPMPPKKQTAAQMLAEDIDPYTGERLIPVVPPDLPVMEFETVYEDEAEAV